MTTKTALDINTNQYRHLLRTTLKHDCFIDVFNSTRQAQLNFLEAEPTLKDFTTDIVTLNISLPFPITAAHILKNYIDNCKELVLQKQQYNHKLNLHVARYKKDKKWLTKKYVRETKYGVLPKYMFDLSVQNLRDPDVYFNGNYNWYYTGGVLDVCLIFKDEHLIYPDNKNLLHITNETGGNHVIEIDVLNETPIYGVTTACDNITIVSLRQKNHVCILELKPVDGELKFNVIQSETSAEVPYIDIKYYDNEMITLKLNRQLEIQDLHKRIHNTHTFDQVTITDSFGQIDYIDRSNIFFLDRKTVRIFDKRSRDEQKFLIQDDYFKCDDLCTFILSNDPNYVFLSSVHNIFKFDVRNLNVVKTWSHMLSSPPAMMKVKKYEDGELIFLSSQNYKDRVVLLSNENESNLVQVVPNNMETWNECNRSYHFNLYNDNLNRLKNSMIGISILKNDKGTKLYTCNSANDIFKNNISMESNQSIEPLDNMCRWFNAFPHRSTQLTISHIRELTHVKDALEKDVDMNTLERYTKDNSKRLDLLSDMTMEDVDMAAIWLTEEDQREEIPFPSTSSRIKVSEWLQQQQDGISDDENTSTNYL